MCSTQMSLLYLVTCNHLEKQSQYRFLLWCFEHYTSEKKQTFRHRVIVLQIVLLCILLWAQLHNKAQYFMVKYTWWHLFYLCVRRSLFHPSEFFELTESRSCSHKSINSFTNQGRWVNMVFVMSLVILLNPRVWSPWSFFFVNGITDNNNEHHQTSNLRSASHFLPPQHLDDTR